MNRVYSPKLNEDPLQAISETNQAARDEKVFNEQNAIRQKMGKPQEPRQVRPKPLETASRPAFSYDYTYQVKVKNNGMKRIRIVEWEYVFFDPITNQEVGRHNFISKTNLKPGRIGNLVTSLLSPPSVVIDAKNAEKKSSNSYTEQIKIKSIQYADGSVWRQDSK